MSAATASRAVILQRAEGLRTRIAAGECPYPDETRQANDAFIARLGDRPEADAAAIAAASERGAWLPDAVKLAGLGTALATTALCLTCAPLPLNVAVAAVGGAAARGLFRVSRNLRLDVAARQRFAGQVRAWASWTSDAPPAFTPTRAPLTAQTLQADTQGFARDAQGFPYAPEMTGGHERLMKYIDGRNLLDVKADLEAASSRPGGRRVPEIIVTAAHAFSVVACGAGAGLLAAGHPLLAAGAFGAFVAREGVRLLEIRRGQGGGVAAQPAAHALQYWERASQPATGGI